jgi:hypothetical protein
VDDVNREEFTVYLGSAQILKGDIDLGLETIDGPRHGKRTMTQLQRYAVRNKLIDVLSEMGENPGADPRIVWFTASMLRGWMEQTGKAKLALQAKTNGELRDILLSTYPPRAKRATDGGATAPK